MGDRLPLGHGREPAGPRLLGQFLGQGDVDTEQRVQGTLRLPPREPATFDPAQPQLAVADRVAEPAVGRSQEPLAIGRLRLLGLGRGHLAGRHAVDERRPVAVAGARVGVEGEPLEVEPGLGLLPGVAVGAVALEERRHRPGWAQLAGPGRRHDRHGNDRPEDDVVRPHRRSSVRGYFPPAACGQGSGLNRQFESSPRAAT